MRVESSQRWCRNNPREEWVAQKKRWRWEKEIAAPEYSQDIRATGHRDSYDSARSPTRQLFCARLVAFVSSPGVCASRCFCSSLLVAAVPAPWSFAPVSTATESPNLLSLSLESSSNLLLLRFFFFFFFVFCSEFFHRGRSPSPSSSRALASSRSPFFCSLFRERVEVIFLPARRAARPGGWGEREARERCSISPLLGLKGADVTYGSRPDCTQLFRRAILMPWTPSANHPPPSSFSSSSPFLLLLLSSRIGLCTCCVVVAVLVSFTPRSNRSVLLRSPRSLRPRNAIGGQREREKERRGKGRLAFDATSRRRWISPEWREGFLIFGGLPAYSHWFFSPRWRFGAMLPLVSLVSLPHI